MEVEHAMTKTFSLTARHIKGIKTLAQVSRISQAALAKEAIEDLLMKYELEFPDARLSQYLGKSNGRQAAGREDDD